MHCPVPSRKNILIPSRPVTEIKSICTAVPGTVPSRLYTHCPVPSRPAKYIFHRFPVPSRPVLSFFSTKNVKQSRPVPNHTNHVNTRHQAPSTGGRWQCLIILLVLPVLSRGGHPQQYVEGKSKNRKPDNVALFTGKKRLKPVFFSLLKPVSFFL